MFETIKRIYKNTRNADTVTRAQTKGWITAEESALLLAICIFKVCFNYSLERGDRLIRARP